MKFFILAIFSAISISTFSQTDISNPPDDSKAESGVSVSPSSVRFNVKPGASATKEVKINNDTKKSFKFKIGFSDFILDANGKPMGVKASQNKYSLSKWVSASPSYFEVKPGESKKITITIEIPNNDTANIAAWTIMMIDQVSERTDKVETKSGDKNTLSMGILPSFGFGVYIYQNPPNVKLSQVEIKNFKFVEEKTKKQLIMNVKNTGDGIGFCLSYVEITNLKTGKQDKMATRQYTILPGFERNFQYALPDSLPKGKYSAVGVMDFGSKLQIETAETEFDIQ